MCTTVVGGVVYSQYLNWPSSSWKAILVQNTFVLIGRVGASPPSRTTGPRCLYICIYVYIYVCIYVFMYLSGPCARYR